MLLLLNLFLVIGLSLAQIKFAPLQKDDLACTTPYNLPGRCIGLRECRNVLELLRRPIPKDVLWYIRYFILASTLYKAQYCVQAICL